MSHPLPSKIAVFVRVGAPPLLVPCRAYGTPAGATWHCAHCSAAVISASFGVLSGFWRCQCGAEVSLFVDGDEVEIQELNALNSETANVASAPATSPQKKFTDQDFLRECGISAGENALGLTCNGGIATEEEPC